MWRRKESKQEGQVRNAIQQCAGTCFDIGALRNTRQAEGSISTQLSSSAVVAIQPSAYTDISPWQTRIIALWPNSDEKATLEADLLAVDLIAGEGVVVTSTNQNMSYDALSYCWGNGPRDSLLELNSSSFAVSSSLQAALRKLRSRTETRYLWVDAICINQDDDNEKAIQVATMLRIFQKAARIHVWLGEASEDSGLAIACMTDRHYASLQDGLKDTAKMKHHGSCIVRLRTIHSALCNFFARPWFRRTWIRQEIYASRSIKVHCGDKSLTWPSLWSARRLLQSIEESRGEQWAHDPSIERLLDELHNNTEPTPAGQYKPLRSLFDILITSQYYQVTDPRDVVYGSLGMCGVHATATSSSALAPTAQTIVVDYKKTLSEVLQDVFSYMLQTEYITQAFHFREPCSQTLASLPSWAVDWQHGCCSEEETGAIMLAVSRHASQRIGHIYTWCPLSPDTRLTYINPPLDDNWHSNEATYPFIASEGQRNYGTPRPLSDGSLELPARVIDYVATLTDYTCELEWLVGDSKEAYELYRSPTLGSAPENLAKCEHKRRFDPARDHRRLAIMRTPANTHIALVPADTEVGGFFVAVAPEILPLVVSPQTCNPPRASEVYYDDPPDRSFSRLASLLKGKGKFSAVAEYLQERRRRMEKVVETFGPHFTMRGPAFAIQGYDFFTSAGSFQGYYELQVERNWLRPIQRFIIH